MASLSTCHLELVVWGGNLVKSCKFSSDSNMVCSNYKKMIELCCLDTAVYYLVPNCCISILCTVHFSLPTIKKIKCIYLDGFCNICLLNY